MRSLATLPLVAAAVAVAALYSPIVWGVARQWFQDASSSHGLLLAAAAIFVAWRRLPSLRARPLRPANAGFALLAFALVVYLLGSLAGELFIQRVSLPFTLAACVMIFWGVSHAKALLASFVLLLMAVPLPAVVVTYLTLPLQLVASNVAELVLTGIGVEVARAGNILMLPNITLEVAEACSGLRSVVSLVSVAAVCGAVMSLRVPRVLMLVGAAIPIAIIGNGYRVAATGLLATWIGDAAVRGWIHELTGLAAFLAMCVATLGVQMATRPVHAEAQEPCSVRV